MLDVTFFNGKNNINSFSYKFRRKLLFSFARLLPDRFYLKQLFPLVMGYPLNLDNPRTFNEKLQWLKLYNRRPEYTKMVDKYEAKQIVADLIGENYIVPTIAVYERVQDIEFEKFPKQFVLKCTHDSGSVIICKDKNKFDKAQAVKRLKKSLKQNFFWRNREWPYKNVRPRIIVEKCLGGGSLRDYKFFAFNGHVKAMFVASDRYSNEETKFDFFDENFNHLPFTNGHPHSRNVIEKPLQFDEMKTLAEKLSKGIPQVRIDFYEYEHHVYFGEMTFFHWSGFTPFVPHEWDLIFGDWITLPR